ncbi:MAG: glycosyltransferase family 4 protein [Terrimicrobiaceae bacterium]
MRVVHICNLPLPEGHPEYGVIQTHPGRWVLNHALAQKSRAIDPHLVVQVAGSRVNYSTEIEGIPVHYLSAPDRFRSSTLFFFDVRRISRYVRSLGARIVHAHGTEESFLMAAQATGLPNLVTLQGCYFLINREIPPGLVSRARIVEFTEQFALRRATHAIAKSEYVGREVHAQFPHLRIHDIPNTFDPSLLEISICGPRQKKSLAFVGTIVERKGVHLIAEALARMLETLRRDIVLHVFGDRPGAASTYEASVLAELHTLLGDRLVTHGTIPAIDVARALSGIECLLAPSLEEMFGNQLIESLLVGCRAIVTEGTAMAENLRRFGGGVVVPQRDPQALATAIVASITGSSRNEDHLEVRNRIQAYMGPDMVGKRHEEVYSMVLEDASLGSSVSRKRST